MYQLTVIETVTKMINLSQLEIGITKTDIILRQ